MYQHHASKATTTKQQQHTRQAHLVGVPLLLQLLCQQCRGLHCTVPLHLHSSHGLSLGLADSLPTLDRALVLSQQVRQPLGHGLGLLQGGTGVHSTAVCTLGLTRMGVGWGGGKHM